MKLLAASQQFHWEGDPDANIALQIFKNTFFIEALGATAFESSSQVVRLVIIKKTSNWHQFRQFFDYITSFENVFCLLR